MRNQISETTAPLTVNAIPPTLSISYLPAKNGDLATETRLQVTATADDADGGDDYINRLVLGNLPAGVTVSDSLGLLSGTTITTTSHPGTFIDEIDIFAPAGKTTNFDLGITAYSDEPHSPEQSVSDNKNIEVDFSTDATLANPAAITSIVLPDPAPPCTPTWATGRNRTGQVSL